MVYVDSQGYTHVSIEEAKKGYAAKTTASRNAKGEIVGDSIGSNYVRQQAKKQQPQPQPQQQPKQQSSFLFSPINFIIPKAQAAPQQPKQQSSFLFSPINFIMPKAQAAPQQQQPKQQPQPETPGFLDRMKNAFNQGYSAGEGKEYNLEGLTKPKTQAKDLYTYSIYEKANNLSKSYDNFQNSFLSPLPSGAVKGFVTGVTNVPEILINTAGSIPLGLESIARNSKASPEVISLGLGTMAGSTVQKARNNPAELAGELIGSYGLGKAAGKAYNKVSPKEIKDVSITETQRQFSVLDGVEKTKIETLGAPREYVKIKTHVAGENELNPLDVRNSKNILNQDTRKFNVNYRETISETNSDLITEIKTREGSGTLTLRRPQILNSEQKTLTGDSILNLDRKKWEADLSGLPDNKYSYKKQYGVEQYFGKETFDYEFATVVKNQRIRPINEIFPEKVNKNPLPKDADKYFDIPKPPKQMSFEDFGKHGEPGGLPTVKYRSLNLLPGEKPGFFSYDRIEAGKNSFKNTVKRLTQDENALIAVRPQAQRAIQEVKVIPGIPKSENAFWKRDIILDELEPKTTTKIKSFEVPRAASKLWAWGGAELALISQPLLSGLGQEVKTSNLSKNSIWSLNELDITNNIQEKTDIKPILIPDIKIKIDPINKPVIDPVIDPFIDPVIDPFIDPIINPVFNDFKLPFMGGGWDISRALNGSPRSRRKTKGKTIKNAWGDPLKVKINLKF